jgi:glutamyl-tRNA reductase
MEDILLVHRKSNAKSAGNTDLSEAAGPVWRTCLRQILFFEETSFALTCDPDDQVLRGAEALKFLFEVLCGLHSPVLGETEVLGQFRLFVEERRKCGDPLFSEHRKWLQFLTAEIKKIRSELICGLGSNSYGGIVRKDAKDLHSFSILGSGHLAMEILPWIWQKPIVQMISRNPNEVKLDGAKFSKVQVLNYEDVFDLGEALVIAAPLQDAEIKELVEKAGGQIKKIFDLRAEENRLPDFIEGKSSLVKISSLKDMFAELAGSNQENEHKINHIKKVISERVVRFMERSELRPMGWDDICA